MTDEELKSKIYKVIEEYMGDPNSIFHVVARDFSETELNKFINVYFDYLMK